MTMLKYVLLEAPWIVIGAILGEIAKNVAYADRGYEAVGGEVFVFPVIVVIGLYVTCKIIDHFRREEEGQEHDCEY